MKSKSVAREESFSHPPHSCALDGQLKWRADLRHSGEASLVDAHAEAAPTVEVAEALDVEHVEIAHDPGDVDH